MSVSISKNTARNFLQFVFDGEWRIYDSLLAEDKPIQTPVFSPIPNCDADFRFEIWHKVSGDENDTQADSMRGSVLWLSLNKLSRNKLHTYEISSSLKLKIDVSIKYEQELVGKTYSSDSDIFVNSMTSVNCINNISPLNFSDNAESTNLNTALTSTLVLTCRLVFYDDRMTSISYQQRMYVLANLIDIVKDFSKLYETKDLSDLNIRIGKHELAAHKFVLASHSPVFLKMVTGDFEESKTNTIVIKDCSFEVFECFLSYLYSGIINDKSWTMITELYNLSEKYDVKTLKKLCISTIKSYMSMDTFFDIVELAYIYEDEVLKCATKKFALHNNQFIFREEWHKLVSSKPAVCCEILNHIVLSTCF